MKKRFVVCEGSLTENESMTHSIIDTSEKTGYDLERMICECTSNDIAEDIASALNLKFGNKQNKVAFEHIQSMIDSLEFKFARVEETTVTGCWAFLPNGFQVAYGESACVDPSNFDFEVGKKYAKERCLQAATNKLWELEGYLLATTGVTSDYL